jgi:bacillithiol biosynthesis cysteine-adding enzyme BshC
MKGSISSLSYKETGYFTSIINDYLDNHPNLLPFFEYEPTLEGLAEAIEKRSHLPTDRDILVQHLHRQYASLKPVEQVNAHIDLLQKENTFTVCTAHQPALFTGPLYFIYKILHAVKLASHLNQQFPKSHFVPVFWMGSEDADLDELGKFFLGTDKVVWTTDQKGAVGRMKTKGIAPLIQRVAGELSEQPYGQQVVDLLKRSFTADTDIQTATLRLLHELFGHLGLVILVPDASSLKKIMSDVFEEDLFQHTPAALVTSSSEKLGQLYKVQAHPRPVNLFYLNDGVRNRIEKTDEGFKVVDTGLKFTDAQIRKELAEHPERFSPNVILRALYQERLLPNIAFIGGGGELAYWLELRELFAHYKVPYPALVLRNSFLLVGRKWRDKIARLGLSVTDFFASARELMDRIAQQRGSAHLDLTAEQEQLLQLYANLKRKASAIDVTLEKHVSALEAGAAGRLIELQKKMLRAERRKDKEGNAQVEAVKKALFPYEGLQERIESFLPYYAKFGPAFIEKIFEYSAALEQRFVVWTED